MQNFVARWRGYPIWRSFNVSYSKRYFPLLKMRGDPDTLSSTSSRQPENPDFSAGSKNRIYLLPQQDGSVFSDGLPIELRQTQRNIDRYAGIASLPRRNAREGFDLKADEVAACLGDSEGFAKPIAKGVAGRQVSEFVAGLEDEGVNIVAVSPFAFLTDLVGTAAKPDLMPVMTTRIPDPASASCGVSTTRRRRGSCTNLLRTYGRILP